MSKESAVKLVPVTGDEARWELPSAGRVGMFGLIAAESAIFVIVIVAYAFYIGKTTSGPTPSILSAPIFISICLLSSSATMELAIRGLRRGNARAFTAWWLVTFALGAIFLAGTGIEWRHLIVDEGLTIHTNLFGTTYYSLVGLHAFHVTVGLILIATVGVFGALNKVTREHTSKVEVLSLYWHFVDSVWVVVFTLVYVVGR
jgi:cytochrome c oxidase subunit 3/cytochrome o ubiquinol oxidase subunit 3